MMRRLNAVATVIIMTFNLFLLPCVSAASMTISQAITYLSDTYPKIEEGLSKLDGEGIDHTYMVKYGETVKSKLRASNSVTPLTVENFEGFFIDALYSAIKTDQYKALHTALLKYYPAESAVLAIGKKIPDAIRPQYVSEVKNLVFGTPDVLELRPTPPPPSGGGGSGGGRPSGGIVVIPPSGSTGTTAPPPIIVSGSVSGGIAGTIDSGILGQISGGGGYQNYIISYNSPATNQVSFPPTAFSSFLLSGASAMRVVTQDGYVEIPKIGLSKLEIGANQKLEILVEPKTSNVIDVYAKIGEKKITDFAGSSVTVAINYTSEEEYEPWFIVAAGDSKIKKLSYYDADEGVLKIKTQLSGEFEISYNVKRFDDVSKTDWFYPYVSTLAAKEIVNGVGESIFAPHNNVTRAEFLKMLVGSFEGIDLTKTVITPFNDVSGQEWYAPYIAWAYQNKVVTGISSDIFGVNDNITRQDMAVMLSRFISVMPDKLKAVYAKQAFSDDASIASYAKDAVYNMQISGIINGMADGSFSPNDNATRAQAAKVIAELINSVLN